MANLAKSLTPTPAGWTGNDACKWPGVNCNGLGNVRSINLSSMAVSGRLPPDFNGLSSLKFLSLQNNRLSGPIPSFSNLNSLEDLNLDDNKFTSVSPNFLSGLTSVKTININDIPTLSPWKFPTEITESPVLVSFSCSRCNLHGEIPDLFGSISGLRILRLSYNNLTGTLPPSLEKSGIQELALNNQLLGLSGGIDVIGKMEHLTAVRLHVNRFTGPIPDLSRCHFLSEVILRDNLLTGVIPDSFTSLSKLSVVSLQNNKFQGPMPNFQKGVQVTLGTTNNFCDPATVAGTCSVQVNILLEVAKDLEYPMVLADSWKGNDPCKDDWNFVACDGNGDVSVINLSNHNWTGSISPAIGNLTELKELILHDNKLTGSIPDNLAKLPRLHLVDISNNNISGKIPDFPPNVILKIDGNLWIGKELPDAETAGKENTGLSPKVIVAITLVAVIQFIVLFFIIYRRCKKMKSRKYKWLKGKSGSGKEKSDGPPINVSPYGAIKSESSGHGSSEIPLYDGGHVLIPIEICWFENIYTATGRVTTKVDVYSFGVVLMEMITGRKALDESLPEESVHLVPWFRRLLANREKLRSILDPWLDPNDETFESICRVADLAGYCTAREPGQRPDMNHAVNFLSPLVEQWIPMNTDEEDENDDDFQMSLPQALQRWKAHEDSTVVSEDELYDQSYVYDDDESCTMERLPSKVSVYKDSGIR
nr:receptor-like kinase TMK4 [Ipomoea batatas]